MHYFLKEVRGCPCGHLQREPREEQKDQSMSFISYTISSKQNALFWAISFRHRELIFRFNNNTMT